MKNRYLFYILLQVLKVLLIKICKTQPPDLLFLFVFISFYVSTVSIIFPKLLELHSTISEKCIFAINFPFLTDSLRHPQPLNSQNPLIVTKVFFWMLPKLAVFKKKY